LFSFVDILGGAPTHRNAAFQAARYELPSRCRLYINVGVNKKPRAAVDCRFATSAYGGDGRKILPAVKIRLQNVIFLLRDP